MATKLTHFDTLIAAPFVATGAAPGPNAYPTYTPASGRMEWIRAIYCEFTCATSSQVPYLYVLYGAQVILTSRNWSSFGASTARPMSFHDGSASFITPNATANQSPIMNNFVIDSNFTITMGINAVPANWEFSALTVYGTRWLA